jgi:nicotinate-nucleotide pyrophosphorylase (carboxylating)
MSFRTIQGGAASRRGVARLPHDRSDLLWSGGEPTALFLDSIDRWVDAMVADEHGGGGGPDGLAEAIITAKASGTLCGRPVVERLLERHFPECSIEWTLEEGEQVYPAQVPADLLVRLGATHRGGIEEALVSGGGLATLQGPAVDILRLERIVLNLLGRLSGIATNTARWVAAAHPMQVAATRKTEWGLLDKWAVHIGGGLTHRLDRGDALLVKENDTKAMEKWEGLLIGDALKGGSIWDAYEDLAGPDSGFLAVEVQSVNQALGKAGYWSFCKRNTSIDPEGDKRIVILLDNMTSGQASMVHRSLRTEGDRTQRTKGLGLPLVGMGTIFEQNPLDIRDEVILEGSGRVDYDSLEQWSDSGVDLVSSSALNRGVAPLDLSMLIIRCE